MNAANPKDVLARNVFALRTQRGWTQADLAQRSGVKQTTISAVERRKHSATVETVAGLALAFRVSPWSLLAPAAVCTEDPAGLAAHLSVYLELPASGRREVDRVAEAEARYHRSKP
jgi:transcriptional regulator with XRE-family HTH domain